MELDIQLFGGRGASSSVASKLETDTTYTNDRGTILKIGKKTTQGYFEYTEMGAKGVATEKELNEIIKENNYKITTNEQSKSKAKISTFTGSKNLDKALENGYSFYRGEDLNSSGRNYKEIARRLKEEGYKVRVFEDTTRVRGLHNYSVLYKRK